MFNIFIAKARNEIPRKSRPQRIGASDLISGFLAVLTSLGIIKFFVAAEINLKILCTALVSAAVTIIVIKVCVSKVSDFLS